LLTFVAVAVGTFAFGLFAQPARLRRPGYE